MAVYEVQIATYGVPKTFMGSKLQLTDLPQVTYDSLCGPSKARKRKPPTAVFGPSPAKRQLWGGANAPNPDLSMPRKTTTYAVTHNAQSLTFGIAAIQAAVAAVQHDHGGGPALGTYLVQLVQFGLYKSLGQKRRQLQPLAAKHQKRVRGGLWRVLSTQLSWR
jgi:hypothetical protein